jgi:hypothetical protein
VQLTEGDGHVVGTEYVAWIRFMSRVYDESLITEKTC